MQSRATTFQVVHFLFWFRRMAYLLQLAVLISLKSTTICKNQQIRGCVGLAGIANFPCRLAGSIKSSMSAQFATVAASNLLQPSGIYLLRNVECCCTCIYIECCRLAGFLLVPVFASMAIMQDSVDCIQY
jgi:hypothetical protein